jgi:hypothetical protein
MVTRRRGLPADSGEMDSLPDAPARTRLPSAGIRAPYFGVLAGTNQRPGLLCVLASTLTWPGTHTNDSEHLAMLTLPL